MQTSQINTTGTITGDLLKFKEEAIAARQKYDAISEAQSRRNGVPTFSAQLAQVVIVGSFIMIVETDNPISRFFNDISFARNSTPALCDFEGHTKEINRLEKAGFVVECNNSTGPK